MVAAAIPGTVHISRDSGATWTASSLPNANWISVDMTPDGQRMVAVAFEGAMYQSTNGGTTWTRIDNAFNAAGNLQYESVTISQDGQRIVAAVMNGRIFTSTNSGAAFTPATGSVTANNAWRAVDSSANGMVVVAASQNGELHLSTDGGLTFAALPVAVGATQVFDGWYRVALSDDGQTIVAAANPNFAGPSSGLYVSRNRGTTWTRGSTVSGPYTTVDTSANGDVIVATLSSGQILRSINGGNTFTAITAPSGETNWRSIAITGNASRLLLAAGTFFGQTGRVYLSSGSVTGN
ncbi:MAG TPA: sialidase family protein [Ramlibacter sp.]|nr:sialidase family protein [Ramlibacter sp.]